MMSSAKLFFFFLIFVDHSRNDDEIFTFWGRNVLLIILLETKIFDQIERKQILMKCKFTLEVSKYIHGATDAPYHCRQQILRKR